VGLDAEQATPPAQVTLTVTDTHPAPLPFGLWYTLSITATSGELTQSLDVDLLVGGTQVYLPLTLRVSSGSQ
jgi:hypothetical protein